jgi:hypothetical protein
MSDDVFDRIAKTISRAVPRRDAVRALAGTSLAGIAGSLGLGEAAGKHHHHHHHRRCRKPRQTCGGKKKCCGDNIACHEFPTATCSTLTGRHCCGLEGAPCNYDSSFNDCDCCDGLFCGGTTGEGRCQEQPV